jgi:hypothetical protein
MTALYIDSLLHYSKTIYNDKVYNNITNIKEKNDYLINKYKIDNNNLNILNNINPSSSSSSNTTKTKNKRKWYNIINNLKYHYYHNNHLFIYIFFFRLFDPYRKEVSKTGVRWVDIHDISLNNNNNNNNNNSLNNNNNNNINNNDNNNNNSDDDDDDADGDDFNPYEGFYKVPVPNFFDNVTINPATILKSPLEVNKTNQELSKKINILQRCYASQLSKQYTTLPLYNILVIININFYIYINIYYFFY